MTPRGSRPSSGGRDGGRLLDPAAEGVDVVLQECPVGAHDQHVDDVEADRISPSGELTASQEVAAISRSPRLADIRRAMTDSKNIPPAARTIAVLRTHEAGKSAWRQSTSPYAWRGRRGTTRRSSSWSSASAPPKRQHVPQAGREGAEDTLRSHRKARNRVRQREHGKVSKRAHHIGRRSALAARPAAISVLHTFDRSKV